MNRVINQKKYFIPILIALFCLLYQAIPLHKIFLESNLISFSILEDNDTTEKDDLTIKKSKSDIDDFVNIKLQTFLISDFNISTIYYFHHLPKSYEVKSVFAPPPELV